MVDCRVNYDVLSVVKKPARYIGGEFNSVYKDPDKTQVRIALAFPDVYEVGMSHLGLKILYNILNSQESIYAERVFAPWPDMEQQMRERGIPLLRWKQPSKSGRWTWARFPLQYELCATTVLQMLDLAGIPLRSLDRTEKDPLVLAARCMF